MAEVRRVRDRKLGRTLALKMIHASLVQIPSNVVRFMEEAQATAQLQHPGIVPVHDLGELPDGRVWFTMKEVDGKTLVEVIRAVHTVSRRAWRTTASGWNLRRLVEVLVQVCDAIAYAHEQGVLHRDLKPSNVMVGKHGEVLVLDWGLVKVAGSFDTDSKNTSPIRTNRSASSAHNTTVGDVAGTPAFMSPEQADGRLEDIDTRTDIYALGAILYTILAGQLPYSGIEADAVLTKVRTESPRPLPTHVPLPPALVETCKQAMNRDPRARFQSADELAKELQVWLDGARRRSDAMGFVEQALSKKPAAAKLRERAVQLRDSAALLMADVKPWHPENAKLPGWRMEDKAIALDKQADLLTLEEELLLHGSLTHCPDLPEAHAALAQRYRSEHSEAEANHTDTSRTEALLRRHVAVLPDDHADRMGHLAYLKGDGALSLITEPAGAEVLLHRYVLRDRRLVPQFERSLGKTPLHKVPLPKGSYLCVLHHPERAKVNYPVFIRRQEHWHGVPPDEDTARPIRLPRVEELGTHECYMPAGWCLSGGDTVIDNSLPGRRVWVDERIFARFPVTNRQYLQFLNALVASGQTEQALRHVPRERGSTALKPGAILYDFDGKRFSLRSATLSALSLTEAPVTMVSWHNARAYAIWLAERTRLPWRLPGELEWEKACRGVDGRIYAWGSSFDPCWASSKRSVQGPAKSLPVGQFPRDESVFGVRDMIGNVTDWCADPYFPAGPPLSTARTDDPTESPVESHRPPERVLRGASWFYSSPTRMRGTIRARLHTDDRHRDVGFRLVRPYGRSILSSPTRS